MSNEVMFIQAGQDAKIVELPIPEKRSESALIAALVAAGLLNDENLRVFVEDAEEEVLVGRSTARDAADPAYASSKLPNLDACGITRLASRTIGVFFVGLLAGLLGVSEILRRLHGADSLELASVSISALADIETVVGSKEIYAHGFVRVAEGDAS